MDNWKIWAAGFFDGEGCISLYRSPPGEYGRKSWTHALKVIVNQKARRPLRKLQEMFPNSTLRYIASHDYHDWTIHSRHAVEFLQAVMPYLLVKKYEAELALAFQELLEKTRQPAGVQLDGEDVAARDAYYWALREAKKGINTCSCF